MLSKKNRTDKKTVDNIFKKGTFVGSANLVLKYIKENNGEIPQISFIAPKGVAKKAVDRNKLRRRGYAVISKYIQYFPVGFSGAFVFGKNSLILFGGRKKTNYDPILDLEKEIKFILKKINLL